MSTGSHLCALGIASLVAAVTPAAAGEPVPKRGEPGLAKQRAMMREFEKHVIDTQAHEIWVSWWYRVVPQRSYVKGWKISPSHFLGQDLATVWLDK